MARVLLKHFVFSGLLVGLLSVCTVCSQQTNISGFSIEDRKEFGKQILVPLKQPLAKRIGTIPEKMLLTWKNTDERINPRASRYQTYQPTMHERQVLQQAITHLPEAWQKLMLQKLARFYFVDNLLGGGITDWIIAPNGTLQYVMILNPALFHVSAKKWLEMKANGSFEEGEYRLVIQGMEGISALELILLHETVHLMDYETHLTPLADVLAGQYLHLPNHPTRLTRGIWRSYRQPVKNFDVEIRKQMNPYHMNQYKPQVSNAKLRQVFTQWKTTPFVTLYASSSWAEDVAELMAFDRLKESTGKSPTWLLKRNNNVVDSFMPLKHPKNRMRLSNMHANNR